MIQERFQGETQKKAIVQHQHHRGDALSIWADEDAANTMSAQQRLARKPHGEG